MADSQALSYETRGEPGEITEAEVLAWLASSTVFEGLTRQDLKRFLRGLRVVNFRAGDKVISEGVVSSSLFIVTTGRFVASWNPSLTDKADNKSIPSRRSSFVKGDCFGEYSLIDRTPASATVNAANIAQALQVPRHTFEAALQSDFRIARTVYHNLLLMLTARLRAANLT